MLSNFPQQQFRPQIAEKRLFWLASLLILSFLLIGHRSRPLPMALESDEQPLPQEADITLSNQPQASKLDPDWRAPADAVSLQMRSLPSELEGVPELMAFRTANSATFELEEGTYKTILSSEDLHYQTAVNTWEIIEPSFTFDAATNSFIVEHNSIRSRAGFDEAWLSATADDVSLRWQAYELGEVNKLGRFNRFAHTLDKDAVVEQHQEGTLLEYRGAWSDATLSEQLISAPNSVEHLLVLEEPPSFNRNAQFLELRATLNLLPNTTLWADGEKQNGRFQTKNSIEIRNSDGSASILLDPVRAFEIDHPETGIAGEYVVWPSDVEGEWIVALRTSTSWWQDPERVYPAVIDPTMRVLRTSGGGGTGMAWLGAGGDAPDQNYQMGHMVLGSMVSAPYFGFMQFNIMPALLTNHPLQVAYAELRLTPSYHWLPSYKHDSDDGPDWEKQTIKHNATLWQINLQNICPDPIANPNCWSMIDNRLATNTAAFNWTTKPDPHNSAQTTELGTAQLAVGPSNKGGKGQTTEYDVTSTVRDWYNNSPQPNHGPAFMIRHNSDPCLVYSPAVSHTPPPYQIDGWPSQVPLCTRFALNPQSAQLHIIYNAYQLNFGQSLLNRPGVPSFYEGALADSNHQYKLATNNGLSAWRAVATRGNHALPQTIPARSDLKLIDYSGTEPEILLENTSSTKDDQTSYILINDHACANSGICNNNVDLRAEVIATNANNYPQDQERNYRVEYELAENHNLIYGTNPTIFVNDYASDELLRLLEFELAQYDSLGIIVTGDDAVEPGLIAPTNDGDPIDTIVTNNWAETNFGYIGGTGGSTQRSIEVTDVEKGGIWAMTLANQEAPVPDIELPHLAKKYGFGVDIMRCPWGTIPTIKWECQPVIIPTGSTPAHTALGFTIYSEGGFQELSGGSWCTTNEGQGTPMIGPAVDNRWTVVGQGSVCWDELNDILTTTPDSGVGLAVPHPLGADRGRVSPRFMYGATMTQLPLPAGVKTGVVGASSVTNGQLQSTPDTRINIEPFNKHWGDVITSTTDYIDPAVMKIVGEVELNVDLSIEASDEPTAVIWTVPWSIYPGSASSYVFETDPQQTPELHPAGGSVDLASLYLRIEGAGDKGLLEDLDYYKLNTSPYAWQFREADAKITQDPTMGGATKLVQGAVLPPGAPRLPATEAGAKSCSWSSQAVSCLDVRIQNYSWLNGDGDKNVPMWELPDIHIQDNMGILMLSDPNGVQVFSKDHPLSKLSAEEISQSFSFDTWNATVTIDQDKCYPDDTNEVTVIRGEGLIGLPSVGETGVPPSVKMAFKLCQTELAEAALELEVPTPGVPVGSSGMGVNLIGGKVIVGPLSTQIELTVGFQTLDGTTLNDGFGTVLIDTGGMFQLTAGATLVGVLDANILLQVAWQPLDVLVNAQITCCGGLIGGELYMHAWIGQGFQNKYPWLDDNSDFHFTGYVQAWLNIPEDYLIEWVPPFDITISLKIAFGEFCTNATCTSYAWGMSGTLTVAGFDVGLYVDDSGPEFIFGSDNHVLIDQFGSSNNANLASLAHAPAAAQASPYQIITPGDLQKYLKPIAKSSADNWQPMSPADHGCTGNPMGPTLECNFMVDPDVGQAVFNTTWQNGNLQASLTAPDNTIIDENNALSYGVTISETAQTVTQVSYAVRPLSNQETILPGNWKLTLTDIGVSLPNSLTNNYRIMWFTDPPAPSFEWASPVVSGTMPVNNQVSLEWTALRASQPLTNAVEMELIYTPVISKPLDVEEFNGTLIASRVKANAGSYLWDVSALASGEYAVGARLNDRFAGNGTIVSWASGTILINDTTPPPAPNILSTTPIHDALLLEFQRPNVPDLAGYLIEYTYPQPDGSSRIMMRRLNPRGKWYEYFDGKQIWFDGTESVRLGGLLDGFTTQLCLRSYDSSGNIGPCNNIEVELPRSPMLPLGEPQELNINVQRTGIFDISWTPPLEGGPAVGYLLAYAPLGCDMPEVITVANEGAAPLDVGNVFSTFLSGLTPGQYYAVGVAAYDGNGLIGPTANAIARYGNMNDGDSDGLPDAWADAWGVSDANADTDEDGANNGDEFQQGSNPLHADSDLDGFYDGEELTANTDLCSTANRPPFQTTPKLSLFGPAQPIFQVATNNATLAEKVVNVFNLGGGNMNWTASSNTPWITLNPMGNSLKIGVDPSLLAPGVYSGTVMIQSVPESYSVLDSTSATEIEESFILPVSMNVLKDKAYNLYLPAITRP